MRRAEPAAGTGAGSAAGAGTAAAGLVTDCREPETEPARESGTTDGTDG